MLSLFSIQVERALRLAATAHQGQFRRGSDAPYFEHVVGVAMILDRLGFDEDMIIAGLLHDVVEDTDTTLGEIGQRFGLRVADLVAQCSEVKLDSHGQTRPWIDRKRGYLEVLTEAPVEARCLALADKLHNLYSIQLDLSEGRPVWSSFHADRPQVLWYYRAVVETCRVDADSQLERLADECLQVLAAIELVGDVAKK